MKSKCNSYNLPDNPNRDYVRWFKKTYHLNGKSNVEIKEIITALKTKEKNQLITNLNDMICSSDFNFVEGEYEENSDDNVE